jgi:penicillin G amidase
MGVRPRSWTRRSAWRAALALLGLSLLAGAVALGLLRASLPVLEGRLAVRGLQGQIEILRDRHGIPHVFAGSERDAYFGLGYSHAQDRLFQMELGRRAASGTLAEVFGEEALGSDRFVRTLGLRPAAEASLQHLDGRSRAILEAYTAGVNALLAEGRWLPPEFYLLRFRPAAWAPVDALVGLKLLAWRLSGNLRDELINVRLQGRLSPAEIAELQPPYPGEAPLPLPRIEALAGRLESAARTLLEGAPLGGGGGVGSNAWAVAGTRTASGKPLLANDPHLAPSAPGIWYLAHLHAPGLDVIGATVPGLPTVILGRNDRVAWAFTNSRPDSQDLHVEQIDPADPGRYRTPDGFRAFDVRQESIPVRGGGARALVVRSSRHGPLLSDADPAVAASLPAGLALALAWVGLRADDVTLQFTVKAATARDAAELRAAARDLHAPAQSVVYADADGAIGLVAAGRVPVRRRDNEATGLVPVPGWLERYDWIGLLPFEELPQETQPASGKLVSANQKVAPAGYPHWLAARWAPPYRAQRIDALLEGTARHTPADFARIQMDVREPAAAELLPLMLPTLRRSGGEGALADRLRGWDGDMAPGRAEPLLFVEWMRQLSGRLYRERLGDLSETLDEPGIASLKTILASGAGQSRWCPRGDCRAVVGGAFTAAVDALEGRYGRDARTWRWGRAHRAVWSHAAFGGRPILSSLFDTEREAAGGLETVNAQSFSFDEQAGAYVNDSVPSLRAIYDLGDPERSMFVAPTGQSGHPLSPFYRDMVDAWSQGRYVPMVTDRDRLAADAAGRLVLVPEPRQRPPLEQTDKVQARGEDR